MTSLPDERRRRADLPCIDLYLGSSIGRWALRRFGQRRSGVVFTLDQTIAADAVAMGLEVSTDDPHDRPTSSAQAISVHYPRIFKTELLARYRAVYNLHPALLPYGRGFFPVFWALWEGTPAGATLHWVTERLDGGPVALQREVPYDDLDTGGSLHARVAAAERSLLVEAWLILGRGGDLPGAPQKPGGSYHSRAEFDRLRGPVGVSDLSAARLVRLARCLTFPGYPGLAVESNGARLELRVDRVERASGSEIRLARTEGEPTLIR